MVQHSRLSWPPQPPPVMKDLTRKGRRMPWIPVTATPPRAADFGGGPFDNSYDRLPRRFYARLMPTPVRSPRLVKLNSALAEALGLEATWLGGCPRNNLSSLWDHSCRAGALRR